MDTKNADFTAADFASQTWTEIDGWETMGAIGDAAQEIATDLINRGRTVLQKGTRRAVAMENNFAIIPSDAGQIALIAAEKTRFNNAFRIVSDDAPLATPKAATISIAAPGVVTVATHGYSIGQRVRFATTGALPTGLVPGTDYYVVSSGFTTGAFSVSGTPGGTAIATTGTQSGTHTVASVPVGTQRLFIALVMSASEQGGNANTVKMLNASLGINSNIVPVAAGA
jgi:hypothetical protein